MDEELQAIVKSFPTTPFLFIGSGLTRRYLGLPCWLELLETFSQKIDPDKFAFNKYLFQAGNDLSKVATLIEHDFNNKWFSDSDIRSQDINVEKWVTDNTSPFKAELALFIKNFSEYKPEYIDEIMKLKSLMTNNIAGIISTNYDCFIEDIAIGYKAYIGQDQLVFSAIQGIAELYKIHGSISEPKSIIINELDYKNFDEKCSYLAAKLMTIFLEYPIIFIGYSLNDDNIIKILSSIVTCISQQHLQSIRARFIFIEYNMNDSGDSIEPYSIKIEDKILTMTKIKIKDFSKLYSALKYKKTTFPAKVLRIFKDDFYRYTLTNEPTSSLRIAGIDDPGVSDEDLVMAIGKPSQFSLCGLAGLESWQWYEDIVLNKLDFSSDEMLTYAYPQINKYAHQKLPVFKHLALSNKVYEEIYDKTNSFQFDNLISQTIKDTRDRKRIKTRSVEGICSEYEHEKAIELIAFLHENEINLNDLETFLREYLTNHSQAEINDDNSLRSNLRRLIRIYDWLKYFPTATRKNFYI